MKCEQKLRIHLKNLKITVKLGLKFDSQDFCKMVLKNS
jgi:hypothetical protein